MNPIVVCTDFSPGSKNAVKYAAKMCALLRAELILLHVTLNEGSAKLTSQQDTEMNAKLMLAADELMKSGRVKVRGVKREGLPVNEIIAVAKEFEASLIVTGSKETAAGSGLVGGLVYDLMHAGLFPMLAVPSSCSFAPYEKIVLALDPKSRNKFDDSILRNFIWEFHSELIITAVAEPGKKSAMLKDISTAALELRYAEFLHRLSVAENENLEKGIQTVVSQNNADLLVIIPHRNHYVERMLKTTKTQKVLKNTIVPMLTLPK